MGQVNSTEYNGRHVTSFHIKALGIKFTKKSKKVKQQTKLNQDELNQDEEVKAKTKKRSLLSYFGKHLKLTKKKNVVKSSSKQLINQNKCNQAFNDNEFKNDYKRKSSIDESIVNELNSKLNDQLKRVTNNQQNNQSTKANQANEQNELKNNELDNELTEIPLTDIPLNSEANSLTHQKNDSLDKEEYDSSQLNKQLNSREPEINLTTTTNKNRLSATFSTYDLKAQLNNSTIIATNNKDQQIKLSSMLNRRSFKSNRLSPLNDSNAKDDLCEQSSKDNSDDLISSSKPLNGLNPKIRPINNLANTTILNNCGTK